MTRFSPYLALPLAALIALGAAPTTQAAGVPPVFHCDKASVANRTEEIATIREYLPQLQDPENDIDARDQQVADYKARLKELELGASSCRELRQVERGQQPPAKTPTPSKPPFVPEPEDDLLAPPEDIDLLDRDAEYDDLLAPSPKTPKPAPKPKAPKQAPMAPFPAPVGTPVFGGNRP